ncbi:hypothetical protein GF327_07450 [Candidatus Woesearchaeota archaeon]|nr:hypothetical protein [Candidatus Woesearchaeota archaeon]
MGSEMKFKEKDRIIASQIYIEKYSEKESPCTQEPDSGLCEAAIPRYYYDKNEGKCKEFLWGGCDGAVPFVNMDVCKNSCEKYK